MKLIVYCLVFVVLHESWTFRWAPNFWCANLSTALSWSARWWDLLDLLTPKLWRGRGDVAEAQVSRLILSKSHNIWRVNFKCNNSKITINFNNYKNCHGIKIRFNRTIKNLRKVLKSIKMAKHIKTVYFCDDLCMFFTISNSAPTFRLKIGGIQLSSPSWASIFARSTRMPC